MVVLKWNTKTITRGDLPIDANTSAILSRGTDDAEVFTLVMH